MTITPRWWSLLLSLAVMANSERAFAQVEPAVAQGGEAKKDDNAPVLVLEPNKTETIGMSKDQLIAEVRNTNPKVARVQSIQGKPNKVLVTGLLEGTSRIVFTDTTGAVEQLDVRVTSEELVVLQQKRRDFLDKVKQQVPTANIDVFPERNGVVILSGHIRNIDSVNHILELARAVFGQGTRVVNRMTAAGVQQVQLEVVVAVVDRSELRQMNFNWISNTNKGFLSSILTSPLTFTNVFTPTINGAVSNANAGANISFGLLGKNSSFTGFLQALRTEALAKVLAEPRITTLSGRPASIEAGGETPILTSTGFGSPTVTYKAFGTRVQFLPVVLGDGKIHLEVLPELSEINAANGIFIAGGATSVPGFNVRRAQAAVEMEDGQTLAIGGLIQTSLQATNTKVPILGDIPFFGMAFSNKSVQEREEELLILVTARLVHPMSCDQLPKYLPGQETRVADDFELYMEGIMEAPRGQRSVCGPNGHYRASHKVGPNSDFYPCNDMSKRYCIGANGQPTECGPNGNGLSGTPETLPHAPITPRPMPPAASGPALPPPASPGVPVSQTFDQPSVSPAALGSMTGTGAP